MGVGFLFLAGWSSGSDSGAAVGCGVLDDLEFGCLNSLKLANACPLSPAVAVDDDARPLLCGGGSPIVLFFSFFMKNTTNSLE